MTELNGIGVDIVYGDPLTVVLHIYLTFVGISGTGIIFTPTDVENSLYDNDFFFGGNFNTAAGICAVFVKSRFTAINIGKLTGIIVYCGVYRNRFLANRRISGLACSANGAGTSILFVLPRPFVPGMTERCDLFDFFVFTFDANSVFAALLRTSRFKCSFPFDVDVSVRLYLFRLKSCSANGTNYDLTTLICASGCGGDRPFALYVIYLFDLFYFEFFTADGTNLMFAAFLRTSGLFGNRPIARRVTERSDVSCLVVFAATRTIEDCITTLRASRRYGINDLACQMSELCDLVASRIVATSTSFVSSPTYLGTSSRLSLVLMYIVTDFCNYGIRKRDFVFAIFVGEIHIVIYVVPICDMAVVFTSCFDTVELNDALCNLRNVNSYFFYADQVVGSQRKSVGVDICDDYFAIFDGNDALIRKCAVGISFVNTENNFNNVSAVTAGNLDVGAPSRINHRTVAAFEFNNCIVAVI